jgi:23S rRNA (guanine745-N1)-methyltransferase
VLEAVVDALACPHCAEPLSLGSGTARCPAGHVFDVARQGYLNLLAAPAATDGDTAEMVAARTEFLASGNYEPIRRALVEAAQGDGLVVELGAGTAYYLDGVVDAGERRTGLALDVSTYAARRAAKAHRRIGSVVCDAWRRLPVRDGVAGVVLDVFAPRNAAEIARILAPGGTLLVVTPNPAHLGELVGVLGLVRVDEDKERRLAGTLGDVLTRTATTGVEWAMTLDHRTARQLVGMGPSAWHTDASRVEQLPEPVTVTASVTLSSWVVRPVPSRTMDT